MFLNPIRPIFYGEKPMKLNPETRYFIENLIPNSEKTPYFLWTEDDIRNFRLIIEGTAVPKKKADLLEAYPEDAKCFDPEIGQSKVWSHRTLDSGRRIDNPFRSINPVSALFNLQRKLMYNRKESARHFVRQVVSQYYPDFFNLDSVNDIAKEVLQIKRSKEKVEEGLEKFDRIFVEVK